MGNHGECVGQATGDDAMSAKDLQDCGEKCDGVSECAGFEYDNHGDGDACTLFRFVNGLNLTTESHLNTHECYTKEIKKVNYCESKVVFSGRYTRMCDHRYHGLCRGDRLTANILRFKSVDLCAAECDRYEACDGFDYDVHDESEGCDLYANVTGAEQSPHATTYECFAKGNLATTKATSVSSTSAPSTVPASASAPSTVPGSASAPSTVPASTTSLSSTDPVPKASSGSAVTIGLIALTTAAFVITA